MTEEPDLCARLRAFHSKIMNEAAAEIDRLQDAKRHALKLADERAKEANRLRQALRLFADEASWRLNGSCDPNSGAFRGLEIAQAALTDDHGK